jgi:hypothetical protein
MKKKLQKENNSENIISLNMKDLRLEHDIPDHMNFPSQFLKPVLPNVIAYTKRESLI